MKFSKDTLNILKNFSTINDGIVFKEGMILTTINPDSNILAKAIIPDKIEGTWGIYSLNRFLGVLSLFQSPEIEIHEKTIQIVEGKKRLNYTLTPLEQIVSPPDKEIKLPDPEIEFDISASVLQEAMKAMSVLGFDELAIVGDRENIYIQAIKSANPSGDVFSAEVGETTAEFKMIFRAENLKQLPNDYHVKISKKGISHWKSLNVEYYISVENSSQYSD